MMRVRIIAAIAILMFWVPVFGAPCKEILQSRVFQASYSKLTSEVIPDLSKQTFRIHQTWQIEGANRTELMNAIDQLRLTGPMGVYQDSALMQTNTPANQQNINGSMKATGTRPKFVPGFLGSTARTEKNEKGFLAIMSDGPVGQGQSQVIIHPTEIRSGRSVTLIEEIGEYSLSVQAPVLNSFYNFMTWLPPGRLFQGAAHMGMGELHNSVFNPAAALTNILNNNRY